jgi:hypothetical protein
MNSRKLLGTFCSLATKYYVTPDWYRSCVSFPPLRCTSGLKIFSLIFSWKLTTGFVRIIVNKEFWRFIFIQSWGLWWYTKVTASLKNVRDIHLDKSFSIQFYFPYCELTQLFVSPFRSPPRASSTASSTTTRPPTDAGCITRATSGGDTYRHRAAEIEKSEKFHMFARATACLDPFGMPSFLGHEHLNLDQRNLQLFFIIVERLMRSLILIDLNQGIAFFFETATHSRLHLRRFCFSQPIVYCYLFTSLLIHERVLNVWDGINLIYYQRTHEFVTQFIRKRRPWTVAG